MTKKKELLIATVNSLKESLKEKAPASEDSEESNSLLPKGTQIGRIFLDFVVVFKNNNLCFFLFEKANVFKVNPNSN